MVDPRRSERNKKRKLNALATDVRLLSTNKHYLGLGLEGWSDGKKKDEKKGKKKVTVARDENGRTADDHLSLKGAKAKIYFNVLKRYVDNTLLSWAGKLAREMLEATT